MELLLHVSRQPIYSPPQLRPNKHPGPKKGGVSRVKVRGSLACKISFFSGNSIYVLSTSIQLSNNGILKEKSISGNIEISIKMAKPTDTEYFCTIYNSFPGEFMVSLVFFYIFVKSEKVAIVFLQKIICIIICILAFE